jgi:DNA-binding transcriptional MerR regulator
MHLTSKWGGWMKNFTITEAAAKFGIKIERLREWVNKGFIEPTFKTTGKGIKNLFTVHDIYRLFLFEKLIKFGITRESAKKLNKIHFEDLNLDDYLFYVETPTFEPKIEIGKHGRFVKNLAEVDKKEDQMIILAINLKMITKTVDSLLRG